MNNIKKYKGEQAEKLAREFLLKTGYKILDVNYKTKFGEIDIISYDKKEKSVVFVEVRYRENFNFGLPQETVNYYKQQKIIKSALVYIKQSNKKFNNYRFDIISISSSNNIEHIKNAFVPMGGNLCL